MSAFNGICHLTERKQKANISPFLGQDSGTSDNLGKGCHLMRRPESSEQDPGTRFDLVGAEFMAFAGFFCKKYKKWRELRIRASAGRTQQNQ